MIKKLKAIMLKDISNASFENNMYLNEKFFEDSIRNNFAGWYDESSLYSRIQFIIQKTQIAVNSSILDVACGHGKFAEILYEKGHKVVGVDISTVLIYHLNNEYDGEIRFQKENMEDISYKNEFNLVMILGNSLSLVPEEKAIKTIQNLSRALKLDGKLFLELDNRSYYLKNVANTRDWNLYGKRMLLFSEHIYQETACTEISRDISIDLNKSLINEFIIVKRLYKLDEINRMVIDSGFDNVKIYGDWDGQVFNENSPKLILIAEKK